MLYNVFLLFQARSEVQKQLQLMATWRMRQDVQQEVSMGSYRVNTSGEGSLEDKIFRTDNTHCFGLWILLFCNEIFLC